MVRGTISNTQNFNFPPSFPPTEKKQMGLLGTRPEDWITYQANDGRRYYYNKVTKVTQWERPSELEKVDESNWMEFKTSENQLYYFNQLTKETTWTQPQELKDYNAKKVQSQVKVEEKIQPVLEKPTPVVEKKEETQDFVAIFKQLLLDSKVEIDWDWNRAMKVICYDKRYKVIESIAEKKRIFQEFIDFKKNSEKEERRNKMKKIKEEFFEMLSKCTAITTKSSYRKIVPFIQNDPRFKAVEKDSERLDFFDDFIFELDQKERRIKEETKYIDMQLLRKLLEQKAYEKQITETSLWKNVKEMLVGYSVFDNLDDLGRLQVWDEFIRDLTLKEDEKREKERKKKKKIERRVKQAFWFLLLDFKKKGKINLDSRWKEFKNLVNETEEYKKVEQQGDDPREIFEDLIDDLEDKYKEDKKKLKIILKEKQVNLNNIKAEDFIDLIYKDERVKEIDGENIKLFYQEIAMKNLKKTKQDRYIDLLKTLNLKVDSEYQVFRLKIQNDPCFLDIETEQERKTLFEEYVAYLQRKEKKRKRGKEEEYQDLKKRKEKLLEKMNE